MCYKVATPKKQELQEYLQGEDIIIDDFEPYYHADGFAKPMLPVQLSQQPARVQTAQWGLLPGWVKTVTDAKQYANTLNAIGEEVFEKASFKNYIGTYRCLLWVKGFFEPHHPSPKISQPYFIYREDHKPFTLGCVYNPWVHPETGEVINTFSILTTPANQLLSTIHNDKKRMPLYIPEASRSAWLQAGNKEDIQALIKTYPDGVLAGHPVSNTINKRGADTNIPAILDPVPAREDTGTPLSLF